MSYQLIQSLYPDSFIKAYSNDSECWCFPGRLKRAFSQAFQMLLSDRFGSYLVTPENQEVVISFREESVEQCKTYEPDTFAKGIKPKKDVEHKVIVRFIPNCTIEDTTDLLTPLKALKEEENNNKKNVKINYPDTLFIIYPNRRVAALFEWYVANVHSPSPGQSLYVYNVRDQYWMRKYEYLPLDPSHVYGLDDKFEMFDRDFNIIHNKIGLLHKVGKSCSLNYFFYGPPGVGKSSLCRAIATKYKLDMYVANLKDAKNIEDSDAIKSILSPIKMIFEEKEEQEEKPCLNEDVCGTDDDCYYDGAYDRITNPSKNRYIIVMIEDFDRYLENCNNEDMSNILNAVDGVEPNDGIIRFFSANNTDAIRLNKAFLTRMNGIWKFDLNKEESMLQRVNELFTTPMKLKEEDVTNEEERNENVQSLYVKKAVSFELSLREVTNHLCRFIMSDDGIIQAYKDLIRFVEEKEIKVMSDAVVINTKKEENEKTEDKKDEEEKEVEKKEPSTSTTESK
ncbi:hypothetical protein ABK040_004340 [Willaertia magna]